MWRFTLPLLLAGLSSAFVAPLSRPRASLSTSRATGAVSGGPEEQLKKLGYQLPSTDLKPPAGNYVPYTVVECGKGRSLVHLAGNLPFRDGEVQYIGRLGADLEVEDGMEAARLCALQLLAQLQRACDGDLGRVTRCCKLGVFVQCTAEFTQQAAVGNGASDLIVGALGQQVGAHARTAVGAFALPRGVSVEIDGVFEIEPIIEA